jgi:hypothetical protein
MKIKQMKPWFSKVMKDYSAITLYPFGIYIQPKHIKDEVTIRHETTHWLQQKEMLCIPFYLWYGIEWLIKLFKYKGDSYYNISFEREAYKWESLNTYNQTRNKYAWFKYIIK